MYLASDTLDDLLNAAFEYVLESGTAEKSSRGSYLENIGVLLQLTDPRARLSRSETKGKPFSAIGELLWYLSGRNDLGFIERYIPLYKDEAESDGTIHGAYGPRLFDFDGINQLDNIISLLKKKPTSRRAVIQLFDSKDITKPYKEIPCTNSIQFLVRDKKLTCCVSMRSNDAFRGLPHDIFCFTMIQEMIAREIDIELGPYNHFVGSFHIYDRDINTAKSYISEGFHDILPMPEMPKGSQFVFVDTLMKAELDIRNGDTTKVYTGLPEYWSDIVRLLKGYELSKQPDALDGLIDSMASPIFRPYIERRKNANKPK